MKVGKTPYKLAIVLAASTALIGLTGCATGHATGETAQDKTVSQAVKRTLELDTIYAYPRVQIYTSQGTTVLSGYVDCWEAKERASQNAMFTVGVSNVQNDIVQAE